MIISRTFRPSWIMPLHANMVADDFRAVEVSYKTVVIIDVEADLSQVVDLKLS